MDQIIANIKQDHINTALNITTDQLVGVLRYLSEQYYYSSSPIIDDNIYDNLRTILEKREPNHPYLKEIGAPIDTDKNAIELPYFMGSMDKIKADKGNLTKWSTEYTGPYVITDKLDGISALLVNNDNVIKMYTRGDGTYGHDITHLIQYVFDYQTLKKSMPNNTAIRGELIMSKTNFATIKDKFKNARNTVAGLVNARKNYSVDTAKLTTFIAYTVIKPVLKQSDQLAFIKAHKIPVVYHSVEKQITTESLTNLLTARKKQSEYDIDGIIVTNDSKTYENPSSGNPQFAFAFKMMTDVANAEITNITWNPSMYGYLKPTIQIKPIELSGVTIKNVTGHNAKYISDNKLGKGSIITIVRSGDVIPYVVGVVKPSAKPDMPDIAYKWTDTNVDIIMTDMADEQQDAVVTKQIAHFLKTIGVKYAGEKFVDNLVANGYDDIFKVLDADEDDLTDIDGIGQTLVSKIYSNITSAFEEINLETLMSASLVFGRGLGSRKLKHIISAHPDVMTAKLTVGDILEIDGFDTISADQFIDNIDKFKQFFAKLEKIERIDVGHLKGNVANVKASNKLADQKIVFTGVRNKELENMITNNGGSVATSVSKNTTIVIYKNDEKSKTSAKYLTAVAKEIPVMTEQEFVKKYFN